MDEQTKDGVHFYSGSQVARNQLPFVILTARERSHRPFVETFIILETRDIIRGTSIFVRCAVMEDQRPCDEDASIESEIDYARRSAENRLADLRLDAFRAGNAAQSAVTNDLTEDHDPIRRLRRLPDHIISGVRTETKSTELLRILNRVRRSPGRG